MVLIYGSRGYSFTRGSGTFHCPRCGVDRGYMKKELKRMGHVFWIPLIPLGSHGEYIECSVCHGQYDPSVLALPTRADFESRLGVAVRSAIGAMIRADSVVTEEERRAGSEIVIRYTGSDYSPEELSRDLSELRDENLQSDLLRIGDYLSVEGKQTLIEACALMAVVDGELHDDEVATLERIALGIGVPDPLVPLVVGAAIRRILTPDEQDLVEGDRQLPASAPAGVEQGAVPSGVRTPFVQSHRAPKDGVWVRDAPDPNTSPRTSLRGRTPVEVLERRGDWANITTSDGTAGWVDARVLRPI